MNTSWITGYVWAYAAGFVAIALLQSWTSRMNQFFFFSRTVPAGFDTTPEAARIVREYRSMVWLGFAAGSMLFAVLVAKSPLAVYLCFSLGIVAQGLIASVGFARAHRLTGEALVAGVRDVEMPAEMTAKVEQKVAVELLAPAPFPQRVLWLMVAAPVVSLVAAAGAYLTAHLGLQQFGDAIAANKADFLLGLGMGLETGGILLWVQLRYFSRHRSAMGRFTVNGAMQLVWLGAAMTVLSVMTVPMHLVLTKEARFALLGVALALALVRMLYGYVQARKFAPPALERHGDEHWLWGMFYYNPTDPTLFIQHRCGPGYTVNFAHRMSWIITLVLVADFGFLLTRHVMR